MNSEILYKAWHLRQTQYVKGYTSLKPYNTLLYLVSFKLRLLRPLNPGEYISSKIVALLKISLHFVLTSYARSLKFTGYKVKIKMPRVG